VAGVVELVDRVVALPPGPELSAALNGILREDIPNARLVEVAQARARQLAHEQAELFADMVEIAHAVPVTDLKGKQAAAVARAAERFEWAAHEIAAGLTWTPTAADRELGFATALVERLPLVYESLRQGHIDRGKARVFVEYLDPENGDLTEEQALRLCESFVPQAPGLTTKQLSDRLYRALHAIDPDLRRRRYERAVQERGVALYLDPRTGTATLVGNGLPADEAAAAAERIDRLVERPPNGSGIPAGGRRSASTSTSPCSTAPSTD
jgi:predicted transcriptional regulator